jgi:hypothetical protein
MNRCRGARSTAVPCCELHGRGTELADLKIVIRSTQQSKRGIPRISPSNDAAAAAAAAAAVRDNRGSCCAKAARRKKAREAERVHAGTLDPPPGIFPACFTRLMQGRLDVGRGSTGAGVQCSQTPQVAAASLNFHKNNPISVSF